VLIFWPEGCLQMGVANKWMSKKPANFSSAPLAPLVSPWFSVEAVAYKWESSRESQKVAYGGGCVFLSGKKGINIPKGYRGVKRCGVRGFVARSHTGACRRGSVFHFLGASPFFATYSSVTKVK